MKQNIAKNPCINFCRNFYAFEQYHKYKTNDHLDYNLEDRKTAVHGREEHCYLTIVSPRTNVHEEYTCNGLVVVPPHPHT
jgi:hypothetical protein